MEIVCINCPQGCRMSVEVKDKEVISIEGNNCLLGLKYAKTECVAPVRVVTAVIPVANRKTPLSVKTEKPIPKEKVFDCMKELRSIKIDAPVKIGAVIAPDICNTGVDVIATRNVE